MSWLSGACVPGPEDELSNSGQLPDADPDDEEPDEAQPASGRLRWVDSGSGPGFETWEAGEVNHG